MSCMMPFIFCAPCDTPIANTRNGTRIENGSSSKPNKRDQPELPHHRDERAGDHQRRAAHATGVGVDDRGGDQRRHAEEHHHLDQAVDQLADQLGEADHVHLDLGRRLALDRGLDAPSRARTCRGSSRPAPATGRDSRCACRCRAPCPGAARRSSIDFALLATRLPMMPARATFCFNCSTLFALTVVSRAASPDRRGSPLRSPRSSARRASTATSPTRGPRPA